jgi:head-tail adaptor
MPRIGEYKERVVILTRSLATIDSQGEEVESWPDPSAGTGEHWARWESPTGFETVDETRRSEVTANLRFRNKVTLAAVDHVRLKETSQEYAVVGVWLERGESGQWQTVCSVASV